MGQFRTCVSILFFLLHSLLSASCSWLFLMWLENFLLLLPINFLLLWTDAALQYCATRKYFFVSFSELSNIDQSEEVVAFYLQCSYVSEAAVLEKLQSEWSLWKEGGWWSCIQRSSTFQHRLTGCKVMDCHARWVVAVAQWWARVSICLACTCRNNLSWSLILLILYCSWNSWRNRVLELNWPTLPQYVGVAQLGCVTWVALELLPE